MNRYLIVKLLSITIAVVLFVVVMTWLSIDTLAAGYFVTLMEKYHISPEPAHDMFVGAIHRYLVWVFLGAVILAAALSYLMMRKVLGPLTRMTAITQDIAAGDFSVRVPPGSADEVGRLAKAFNHMAENLEKLEKLRRNLMIDVAHELRTPLTNIRGYLEALIDQVVPPTTQTFTLLMNETLRLASLVEDVLDLARADAARGKLDLEPVDVKDILSDVLTGFDAQFQQKNIAFHLQAPPHPVVIPADRGRLMRVLRNLADNTARYAPTGCNVSFCLTAAPDAARIEIVNPAGGVTAGDLPFLFERFYRGEKSRSREHGGAGIGLSIVKELVEAHGGSVGASLSEDLIHISVTLPTAQDRNEADPS
ncbi:MAG: HAMP domain-containing protein [Deltaproteobacteria bacterium]|nr:HAMP domain-containing protein [Deltaproteobacteria bacterium]